MHRAIANAVRPGTLDPRTLLRVKLTAIPVGQPRIIGGLPVFLFGVDLFAINGVEGQHDIVSASSVLAGTGNPLPEISNQ